MLETHHIIIQPVKARASSLSAPYLLGHGALFYAQPQQSVAVCKQVPSRQVMSAIQEDIEIPISFQLMSYIYTFVIVT